MAIMTIGIDLAKNVFAVHGVDENGKAALIKPKVTREQLPALIVQLPPCLIGMEACTGAHHWARLFRQYGHTVRLIAPNFVTPYRMSGKRGKNDAADAAALYNRLRGLIAQFGIVLPQKVSCLRREIGAHLEDLPGYANQCVGDLLTHADRLDVLIETYDRLIAQAAREDARSKRLMQLPGIGPTTASALLASLGGAHEFNNGRQVAAWIGLVPEQYSSGGKARLGRITKAGDSYLRSLLVMGARVILSGLGEKQDRFSRWARSLAERRGYWKAVVAIAAKNARLAWAVLRYGDDFRLAREAT